MNIVTRFGPTVSGQIHLGSLWNAMLNYLYAKKHSGKFNLRLDGHYIKNQRILDRDNILKDLKTFGFEWDEEIHQADKLNEHISSFKELVKNNPNSFYECDCTINDIARRNLFPSNQQMYRLLRPEKYPRPCKLQKIEIFDINNVNVALNQKISASHEDRTRKADILLTDKGDYSNFWSNTDIGNLSSPDMTTLTINLEKEEDVCGVQLIFREYPFLDYQVYVEHANTWKAVARVNKPVEYFVEPRPSFPYPLGLPERLNFAPVKTTSIKIEITRLPLPLDRPYHYDYHCKSLNKKLDWNKLETVIRCHYNPETYMDFLEIVTNRRIPHKRLMVDTAAWFDGKPDLVFTSPYDDKAMGATHLIRGNDIYPFFHMEVMLTKLLDFKPLYFHHPMVVDPENVKYSKFINSRPISSYLDEKITPGKVLGYLAWKGRLTDFYPGEIKLDDLISHFSLNKIGTENIVIDDVQMIADLS